MTEKQNHPVNLRIYGIGILWGLIETAYFGWHLAPGSDAEIICDGLAFLIVAMAYL